jgi:short-subunit dehydrogenase
MVAVITGASKGLGKAMAEKFISQGFHLGDMCQKQKRLGANPR